MSDLVLVTGISGFLGSHVAKQLLEAGYRVRGSLRSLDKADHMRNVLGKYGPEASLEFCALDLTRDEGWNEAMEGVRYLQHVASPFVINQPDDKMELIRPALEGTERALNAALGADVERIVLTSSMAAVMYGYEKDRTEPFTASDWTRLDGRQLTPYTESKTLAEKRAWELMDEAGRRTDLVTINPVAIFGPLLDRDPGTSPVIVQRMMKGSVPAAPRISLGIIDVRDVAEAHVKAMQTPGAGGNRYPISASTEWMIDFARQLGRDMPQYASKMPKFQAPDWAIRLFAMFDKDVRDNIGELGYFKEADASAARELLGHDFISADAAILATAQSLHEKNLV